MAKYTHLSIGERHNISLLLREGLKSGAIAKQLRRHRSTICREIFRNKETNGYQPDRAQDKAKQRSFIKPLKLENTPGLYSYIAEKLQIGWSPEQIAGRMRLEAQPFTVCHETLYKYVYHRSETGLCFWLPSKRRKRKKQGRIPKHECRYGEEHIITSRPKAVEKRNTLGHWEGDLIMFSENQKNSITTLVERKSRLLVMIKNTEKVSKTVMNLIRKELGSHPGDVCKTITFDQGTEFSSYQTITSQLPCEVYYCHRHSPWEKGSNENTNGRIRRFLPRKTQISNVSQKKLDQIANQMNTQPRKCLEFKTPKEFFLDCYEESCRT